MPCGNTDPGRRALKVHRDSDAYQREKIVYLRLRANRVDRILGLNVKAGHAYFFLKDLRNLAMMSLGSQLAARVVADKSINQSFSAGASVFTAGRPSNAS